LTGCTDFNCRGRISQLYHNDGGGTFSLDTAISPPEVGPSSVAWGDYDNDGRLDFLLTGYDCWGNQISQLYHNDGGGRFSVAPGLSLPGVSPSSVAWGDYNNDGRLDFLLIGNTGSGLISQLYHNDGAIANTPPTAPGGLTVTAVTTRTAALQWTAAADSQTTQTLGLNYNLRVGTRPGASDVVNPAANTALLTETTGLRRLPALGPARPNLTTTLVLTPTTTYYWSVQAIDTAFAGGPFAPEASFTTPCWATFSDVYPTDYFYTPVQYLYCHGVLSGYSDGSFRPYTNTTRAQMVKIVVLGFAKPLVTPAGGAHTFADVPPAHPFFAVVETAAADTIVSGYTCGGPNEPCDTGNRPYFRPGANVTRGQLAKIVVSAAAWPLWNPPLGTFADVLPGSAFYGFVETASCNEVISGYACGTVPSEPCDGQYRPYYRPANSATRGQIAKIADLALTGSLPCVGPARSPTPVPSAPTTTVTPTLLPPTATATPPPTPPAVTATATP
ncbi:MAG TPA: S-layer homology domain-containing protein, partial [Chloroflexia bacterium]|nr:S-layer homology domain-containing protein [Chloroflexia bacterium]